MSQWWHDYLGMHLIHQHAAARSDFLLKCFDYFQDGIQMRCEGNGTPSAGPWAEFRTNVVLSIRAGEAANASVTQPAACSLAW